MLPRTFRNALPAPAFEPPVVVQALLHAASEPGKPAVIDGAGGERVDELPRMPSGKLARTLLR